MTPDTEALIEVERAASTNGEGEDGWNIPATLGSVGDVPSFPIDAIPEPMGAFMSAAAASTRTPVDLVAGFALGALATITGGRLDASPWPGWVEPTNLWTAPAAAPGEGKSPAFSAAIKPIVGIEQSLHEAKAREVAEAETIRRIEENRLADVEREAARAHADARFEAEGVARELAALVAALHATEPKLPELFTTDATPEAIEDLLANNRGRIAWLSDEAGLFTMAAGRYTKDATPQNFLAAWSGGPLKPKRVNRKASVPCAILTVSCAVQPVMLTAACRHASLVGTGFLDRFLFLVPPSIVGYRPSGRTADYAGEMLSWEWLLRDLLDQLDPLPEPRLLTFTAAAESRFVAWREVAEQERRPDGVLSPIVQWSTKLDGQLVRLAALMAIVAERSSLVVDEDAVVRAVALVDYFVGHARAAFAIGGGDGIIAQAREVAAWLVARGQKKVTRREIHRAFDHRYATITDLAPMLELFIEYGWIVLASTGPRGPGRPSIAFDVNPHALALHSHGRKDRSD